MSREQEERNLDDLILPEFNLWWEKHGCLIRSGGGNHERTFAFGAFRHLMPKIMGSDTKQLEEAYCRLFDAYLGMFGNPDAAEEVIDPYRLENVLKGIIAKKQETPRWTIKDQQAGRDPKVGDRCFSDNDKQPARVIAKDVDGDFWIQCDSGHVRCTDQHKISPLETPEEKAIRLEDEFRDAIYAQTSSLFKTSDEIKAFNVGVRSAYRAMNKQNEQS